PRMESNRSALNSSTRSEIPAHIKEHFVRFHVVMHPRNLDCFRMGIEQARGKGADNVAADFKGLMNRRRLMHRSRDRLKILCVEGEWINISVPAHYIEGMMCIGHASPARAVFDQNLDVFVLVDGE